MSLYRLVDDGYPTFKKIKRAGKWVGRVVRHADGGYLGIMHGTNGQTFRAATEIAAFEGVVARHLGHPDVESLRAKNRQVRAETRYARARFFEQLDRETGGLLSEMKTLTRKFR